MIKIVLSIFFIVFFTSCATWSGVKQDSKDAWNTTKETTSNVYKGVKQSIHEATAP